MVCALTAGSSVRAQEPVLVPDQVYVTGIPETIHVGTTKGPYYYNSEAELRARKFGRGFCNVVLCPAEVPNQMFQEAYKTSPITGMIVGFFKGVYKGGARLGVGFWEMATFYFPGVNNYQPYIMPEVVFQEYLH